MPNGDAFRATRVRAIRLVADETLKGSAQPLFAVMIELDEEAAHCIGSGLSESEARRIANMATREVNVCLGTNPA